MRKKEYVLVSDAAKPETLSKGILQHERVPNLQSLVKEDCIRRTISEDESLTDFQSPGLSAVIVSNIALPPDTDGFSSTPWCY